MGFVDNFEDVLGYAAKVRTKPGATVGAVADQHVEDSMNVARSWAGLLSQNRILISVEHLASGQNVHVLVAHETAHDVLMLSSVFGHQQLAMSVFAEPPWPPGVLRRTVHRLLAASVNASLQTQEACATFLPSLVFEGEEEKAYWTTVPDAYRDVTAPLTWIRERGLPHELAEKLIFALGEFALSIRMPAQRMVSAQALSSFFSDAANHPDQRFVHACAALKDASSNTLTALASADAPAQIIAERWCSTMNGSPVSYEPPVESGDRFREWWDGIVAEMADVWAANPRLPDEQRTRLLEAAGHSELLWPIQMPGMLKAVLVQTESVTAAFWDHPPTDRLLPYELVRLSRNPSSSPIPGIELVDGGGPELQQDETALWVNSPRHPPAAARLSADKLQDYLSRVSADTTLCAYDGGYFFLQGDLLVDEPLLRDRPHLVFVQQRSLGALLKELGAFGEIAGEREARYAVVGSESPSIAYFLISPAVARYPIVVVPVPSSTAGRARMELAAHGEGSLRWTAVQPFDFLADRSAAIHLVRLFAWFESKPWPTGTTRPTTHSEFGAGYRLRSNAGTLGIEVIQSLLVQGRHDEAAKLIALAFASGDPGMRRAMTELITAMGSPGATREYRRFPGAPIPRPRRRRRWPWSR